MSDVIPAHSSSSFMHDKEKSWGRTLTGVVASGESQPEVGEEERCAAARQVAWERVEWESGEMRERRACDGCWLLEKVQGLMCCVFCNIF